MNHELTAAGLLQHIAGYHPYKHITVIILAVRYSALRHFWKGRCYHGSYCSFRNHRPSSQSRYRVVPPSWSFDRKRLLVCDQELQALLLQNGGLLGEYGLREPSNYLRLKAYDLRHANF